MAVGAIPVLMKQFTSTKSFFLMDFSNLVENMIPYVYPWKWFFSLELSCIALRKNSAKANSGAVLSVLFCFCCNVSVTFIWTSKKGWSFDICDNLASYCTCALWKYFSNSYFLNLSLCLHLLSNRKINR